MRARARSFAGVVCAAIGAALGAVGCLGGDDTSVPGGGFDAGRFDVNVPVFDAGGLVDGAPGVDAGLDAQPDAAPVDAGPIDAGADVVVTDSGVTGKAGLVPSGTTSRSPKYVLSGTAGPATGVVLRSPKYQLVGGMAVSTQTQK